MSEQNNESANWAKRVATSKRQDAADIEELNRLYKGDPRGLARALSERFPSQNPGVMLTPEKRKELLAVADLPPDPVASPVPTTTDDPALLALTPNEQAIFDELSESPMPARDIVAALARNGIKGIDAPALSRACKRKHMKSRGVRVRKGAGYYKITPPK
jgi:hypothetical protein